MGFPGRGTYRHWMTGSRNCDGMIGGVGGRAATVDFQGASSFMTKEFESHGRLSQRGGSILFLSPCFVFNWFRPFTAVTDWQSTLHGAYVGSLMCRATGPYRNKVMKTTNLKHSHDATQ